MRLLPLLIYDSTEFGFILRASSNIYIASPNFPKMNSVVPANKYTILTFIDI